MGTDVNRYSQKNVGNGATSWPFVLGQFGSLTSSVGNGGEQIHTLAALFMSESGSLASRHGTSPR
ncbi:hypothetical protein PITC_078060 [Penicillium italicum]|uniref:Uncharacterized protein n=1 Tax=Penicillium italicum TaxID=40296 RepID=A0A0A2KWX7_PENIT|nr:hypothetical protein PITC_078060 [Penicillium italicum]